MASSVAMSSSSTLLSQFRNPKGVTLRGTGTHVHSGERTTSINFTRPQQYPFTRLLFTQGRGFSRLLEPIHAVESELDTIKQDLKDIRITLRKAKVAIKSREGDKIQVRVDLTGKQTQKVFDDVLTNLALTAPLIPSFRQMEGEKTSNENLLSIYYHYVQDDEDLLMQIHKLFPPSPIEAKIQQLTEVPKQYLLRAMGETRFTKFVLQQIVTTTMTVYVDEKKKDLKVKKEFMTIQSAEELQSVFKPGKDFGFNATLQVEKSIEKAEPVS